MLQISYLYYIENALKNLQIEVKFDSGPKLLYWWINFYGLFNDRPVSSSKVIWASEPYQSGDITVSIKSLLLYL